eukprot:Pgem_evm1s4600
MCGIGGALLEAIGNVLTEGPQNSINFEPNQYLYIIYIVAEPFFFTMEFMILNALYTGKPKAKLRLKIAVVLCGLGFLGCRFYIGSIRYITQSHLDSRIIQAHFPAFLWLFLFEFAFSICILKICRQRSGEDHDHKKFSSLFRQLLKSNLMIIFSLD